MYFGTDNEEFRCNKSGGTSASYVYQVIDDTYGGNEICMGEILGLKDINSYRYNLKINFSFALILLEFIIMIFFSMNYYYIHEKNQYIRRKIIITYIHNQDGEKSCAVIS